MGEEASAVEAAAKEQNVAFGASSDDKEAPKEQTVAVHASGGEEASKEEIVAFGASSGKGELSGGLEMEAAARGSVDEAEVVALNDDMISLVIPKLPTRDEYRCLALAHEWSNFVSRPISLRHHLYPPPVAFGVLPSALLVQPKYLRPGFVHLVVVGYDYRRRNFGTNIPVHPKYERFAEDAPSTFASQVPADAASLVQFVEKTVPMLDIEFVASHGSLLLARSPTILYVCIPATGRWIKLPPPVALDRDTAFGICYTVDSSKCTMEFLAVLLVRVRGRRLVVLTFSSKSAYWMVKELGVHGAARCLGVASPGIHARRRFFWLSQKRPGRVVCYDVASGRVSVFREPPLACVGPFVFRKPPVPQISTRRQERSLGSVNGRLRLSALDIDNSAQEIKGFFTMWHLNDEGCWKLAHKDEIHKDLDDPASAWMDYYLFFDMKDMDCLVDFADASDSCFVLERMGVLQKRDLSTGQRLYLTGLHPTIQAGTRHHLYRFFDVFPLFM